MNKVLMLAVLGMSLVTAFSQTLPVITTPPTNVTVYPGSTAALSVTATGATSYQWLFNGSNIPGATAATLSVANAQSTNSGYYLVLAKNATGWTPSQMAYLSLDYTYGGAQPAACGTLPLSNTNDLYFAGDVENVNGPPQYPPNGTVQIIAGPELDQLRLVGTLIRYNSFMSGLGWFYNGYYNAPTQRIPTALPGQPVYYGVWVTYTNGGGGCLQPSTIMKLVAGTNGLETPSTYGLKFPAFDAVVPGYSDLPYEDPDFNFGEDKGAVTNQLRVVGETLSLTNVYFGYTDYGVPTAQWRKNGVPISGATNNIFPNTLGGGVGTTVLTLTNLQASDAGIYDVSVAGVFSEIGPKITLSIQTTNGQGVFLPPELIGTNLVFSLTGAAGRAYQVQTSTNLTVWSTLTTLTNLTGKVLYTNSLAPNGAQFFRTMLLP